MQNVKSDFGIVRYGAIALLAIFIFTVFCAWPSPASLFFWKHMHEAESAALATWISAASAVTTALATILLFRGLWLTRESMEDAKRTAEETRRTSLLGMMYQRFCAPNLCYARAVFAKTHLDRKRGLDRTKDRHVPDQGFQIIIFLCEVGHLVKTGRLDIEDVALAFGTHVRVVGGLWKEQLGQEFRESRYGVFFDLYEKVIASPLPNAFSSELDLFLDEPFWECEAALDRVAKSQDDPSLPTDA